MYFQDQNTQFGCNQLGSRITNCEIRCYHRNSNKCLKIIDIIKIIIHILWFILSIFDIYFINFYGDIYFPYYRSLIGSFYPSLALFFIISCIMSIGYFFAQKSFQNCNIYFCNCIMDEVDTKLIKNSLVSVLGTIFISLLATSLQFLAILNLMVAL